MTNLSARQFAMLKALVKSQDIYIDNARELNQTSFGSLYHRGYLEFNRLTKHFYVTNKGLDALAEFREIEIRRKITDGPFSHYFPEPQIKRNNVIRMKEAS